MPANNPNTFYKVITILQHTNIPLENLIRRSLVEPGLDPQYVNTFVEDLPRLLGWLLHHERTRDAVRDWMKREYMGILTSQVKDLTRPEHGLHFNAGSITAEKMKTFSIDKIAGVVQVHAPDVWELVGNLMTADPVIIHRREKERKQRRQDRKLHENTQMTSQEPQVSEEELFYCPVVSENEDEPEDIEELLEKQQHSLLQVRQVTCISIMMQATSQRCNALQALVGVFLQSCNVPEQTRNFVAHLGISVSVPTITRAIKHLSQEAHRNIQRLGSSLLTSYAYDNLDIDLVHSTPTLETSTKDTLVHLTTASMFPLHPITTKADLDFSDHVRQLAIDPPLPSTITVLLNKLPSKYNELDDKNRSIQDRFNSWKFRSDLVKYGPTMFAIFQQKLGEPEEIEVIPLTKTKQVPLRASKTGPSTPAKNATVIEEFFHQSNIGDSSSDPSANSNRVDTGNTVIPAFGDLLTIQHMHSLQTSRIDDISPGQRFQSLVPCHGWFHARMACADAIWRRHIKPSDADKDTTSLMKYVTQIRPLEKHKIQTNPTFRQLHEVIMHVGIVLRLDAWRVEVCRRHPEISSLEDWAKTNPDWEEIVEIADELAETYIAPPDFWQDVQKQDNQRDISLEITKAYHKDFLLYEETNYAMNHGDIGRLDACLTEWMQYFMGCGKVKYAHEILRYLENMYVIYPKPLANALRMNSLVNPTGRKDHFRGIDWVIEHNNLYIKRIFGGSGSNHTIDRMVEASPLVEVYKDVRVQFEQMFLLSHKTSRHSPPKMKLTFNRLAKYMEKYQANIFIPGRQAKHELIDVNDIGMQKLLKTIEEARERWVAERKRQEELNNEADSMQISMESSEIGDREQDEIRDAGVELETEGIEASQDADCDERVHDESDLFVDEVFT